MICCKNIVDVATQNLNYSTLIFQDLFFTVEILRHRIFFFFKSYDLRGKDRNTTLLPKPRDKQ